MYLHADFVFIEISYLSGCKWIWKMTLDSLLSLFSSHLCSFKGGLLRKKFAREVDVKWRGGKFNFCGVRFNKPWSQRVLQTLRRELAFGCTTIIVCPATRKTLMENSYRLWKEITRRLMWYSWVTRVCSSSRTARGSSLKLIYRASYLERFYCHLNQVPWWVFVNARRIEQSWASRPPKNPRELS